MIAGYILRGTRLQNNERVAKAEGRRVYAMYDDCPEDDKRALYHATTGPCYKLRSLRFRAGSKVYDPWENTEHAYRAINAATNSRWELERLPGMTKVLMRIPGDQVMAVVYHDETAKLSHVLSSLLVLATQDNLREGDSTRD